MLLQVDKFIINTDQIKYIRKIKKSLGVSLEIYFAENLTQTLKFKNEEEVERFIGKLGKVEYFA